MNVLFTLAVFAVAAAWALLVYRRLVWLRNQVKLAWTRLDADQSNEAIRTVYNKHVVMYNDALESFPANIVAMVAGLKPARRF
ncbi:MAG TPA: LemA family protein [Vicinamibacterales bacterium]|nr:LemA family protein [Vicinamibacterales bacterium]